MVRGRPKGSQIRQNIIEILSQRGPLHGYRLSKIYNDIFAPVSQRSVYYHLKKGVETREIAVNQIIEEHGDYSWGRIVEKIYYEVGPEAKIFGSDRVRKVIS